MKEPSGSFTEIDAGDKHTCAIDLAGDVQCWGLDDDGQAGDHVGPYTVISAGSEHTCGVKGGSVDCWGSSSWGQIPEMPTSGVAHVSAGLAHTCAVDTAGTAACVGFDSKGQASP